MITFQKELFAKLFRDGELADIFYRHWEDVALDKDIIKLDPDWLSYLQMELCGMLHMMTVRADGILVGYYIVKVSPGLHYKSRKMAITDIFYILPEHREGMTGYKLFAETEKMLKDLGVFKFYCVTKAHLPINIIMKRRGYRLVEKVYTKLL